MPAPASCSLPPSTLSKSPDNLSFWAEINHVLSGNTNVQKEAKELAVEPQALGAREYLDVNAAMVELAYAAAR
jgi:hypothetical protein